MGKSGMTIWLRMGGSSGIQEGRWVNLSEEPCPTVTAEGIGVVCIRGWQYWIEVYDTEKVQPKRELPASKID